MAGIGFVGLGAMGLPMALRLVAAGFSVRGFDLKAAALDALAASGGTRAASAAEAAAGADVLVLMVVNSAQARAVLFDGGALAARGARRQALPRRRAPGPGRDGQDRQPAPVRRPYRGCRRGVLARRQGRDRSPHPARDPLGLGGLELDAEGSRPAHA